MVNRYWVIPVFYSTLAIWEVIFESKSIRSKTADGAFLLLQHFRIIIASRKGNLIKKRLCGSWSVFVLKDNIFLPGQSFTCIGKYKR